MSNLKSIYVKVAACLITAIFVILFSYYFLGSISDNAAKATVVVGVIAFLGTLFTAMFTELAAYYKDKRLILEKKWEIIFPLIKQHYHPWLNSGKSMQDAFDILLDGNKSPEVVTRLLYLIMVFYSYRLQLVLREGSVILFMTIEEEKKADRAYRSFRTSLNWAGSDTPRRVSQLQNLFINKNKLDDPYVQYKFVEDIRSDSTLEDSRNRLNEWVKIDENLVRANANLNDFIENFEKSIDKLYAILNA